MPAPENPAELKSALMFGALYAIIILAVAAAKDHFGSQGLYVVAVLSGLTDMDAITLSTAQLVGGGQVEANTGWRVILIAAMSNLLFKGGIVAALGGKELLRWIAVLFGAAIASGRLHYLALAAVSFSRRHPNRPLTAQSGYASSGPFIACQRIRFSVSSGQASTFSNGNRLEIWMCFRKRALATRFGSGFIWSSGMLFVTTAYGVKSSTL
jgi:hypothetical protein